MPVQPVPFPPLPTVAATRQRVRHNSGEEDQEKPGAELMSVNGICMHKRLTWRQSCVLAAGEAILICRIACEV